LLAPHQAQLLQQQTPSCEDLDLREELIHRPTVNGGIADG
jgi:hypothetical protein